MWRTRNNDWNIRLEQLKVKQWLLYNLLIALIDVLAQQSLRYFNVGSGCENIIVFISRIGCFKKQQLLYTQFAQRMTRKCHRLPAEQAVENPAPAGFFALSTEKSPFRPCLRS